MVNPQVVGTTQHIEWLILTDRVQPPLIAGVYVVTQRSPYLDRKARRAGYRGGVSQGGLSIPTHPFLQDTAYMHICTACFHLREGWVCGAQTCAECLFEAPDHRVLQEPRPPGHAVRLPVCAPYLEMQA